MFEILKRKLSEDWYPMRWVALAIGLVFAVEALLQWDLVSGLLGAVLLFQAVTNTGCMSGRCGPASGEPTERNTDHLSEVEFTEINND